ncbi:hypothetical protein [Alcanivorax sp.]|uniref:hypothetical protein n=1 Tax=Alcanivorax sp. TaxID=1872427 RepID=UPI0025C4B06B|nr:hypothetical protein [Alcanivorax sp.]
MILRWEVVRYPAGSRLVRRQQGDDEARANRLADRALEAQRAGRWPDAACLRKQQAARRPACRVGTSYVPCSADRDAVAQIRERYAGQ